MSGIENQILVQVQLYVIKILTLHTGPLGTELSERIFKNVIRYNNNQIWKKMPLNSNEEYCKYI